MDGGQLEKDIKFGKFFVHVVIPLFESGLRSYPNTLIFS